MNLSLALEQPLLVLEGNVDLLQATVAQLEKDFSQNGLDIKLSTPAEQTLAQLSKQLQEVFEWLLEHNEQRLMQLLYRIDLGEEKLQQAMRNNHENSLAALLSMMVLKREAQKVIIRYHYKSPK